MSLASHVTVHVHVDPRTPFARRLMPDDRNDFGNSFTSQQQSSGTAAAPVVSWTLVTRLSLRDPENLRTFLFSVGEDVTFAGRIDMDLFLLTKRTRGGHDIALDTRRGVNELMLRDGDHLDWKLDAIAVQMKQQSSVRMKERESLSSRSAAADAADDGGVRPTSMTRSAAAGTSGNRRQYMSASASRGTGKGLGQTFEVEDDGNRNGDDEDASESSRPDDDRRLHQHLHESASRVPQSTERDADYDYCEPEEDDEEDNDAEGMTRSSGQSRTIADVMRASRASRLKILREFERSQAAQTTHDALLPEFDELGNPIVSLPNVEDYLMELENEDIEVELHEISAEMESVIQEEQRMLQQQQRQSIRTAPVASSGSGASGGVVASQRGVSLDHTQLISRDPSATAAAAPLSLLPLRIQQRLDAIICQICRKMTLRAALAAERMLEDRIREEFENRAERQREQWSRMLGVDHATATSSRTLRVDGMLIGQEYAKRNDDSRVGLQGRIVVTSLGEPLQRAYLPSVLELL